MNKNAAILHKYLGLADDTYSVKLNTDKKESLENLSWAFGGVTIDELFNMGLSLLSYYVKERANGSILCSMNEDDGTYKEVVINHD